MRCGCEMQGISCAQAQRMLIDELGRCAILLAVERKNRKGFDHELVDDGENCGALVELDLANSQLDRERGRQLGDSPVADPELLRVLLCEPGLRAAAERFVG